MKHIVFVLCMLPMAAGAQIHILRNASFEGDSTRPIPFSGELIMTAPPPYWEDYIIPTTYDDERWLTDSIYVQPNQNAPLTPYNNAYYGGACTPGISPFDSNGKTLQQASHGRNYVGFNHASDGSREGIQQKIDCPFNSGHYTFHIDYSRPINCGGDAVFFAHIGRDRHERRKQILRKQVNIGEFVPGTWYTEIETFELNLTNNRHQNNDWLSITGSVGYGGHPNMEEYLYLDNLHLFRYCDVENACWAGSGQICPTFALQAPPDAPFAIKNIGNATELQVRITSMNGSVLLNSTYTNSNGFPDFYWPGEILAGGGVASAPYAYEVTISNQCGGVVKEGTFTVLSGHHDTIPHWSDLSATWTPVPRPCCLSTLNLENIQLNGNLTYIVRDSIIVNNVSATHGSNIILQAGQVIELTDVEFDSTVSNVEIIELPCPARMASPEPSTPARPPKPQQPPAVNQVMEEVAKAYDLALQVYPNPFTDGATIAVQIPDTRRVSITLHNSRGTPIHTVVDKDLAKGQHTFTIKRSDLPAGLYVLRMEYGDQMRTTKIVKQ